MSILIDDELLIGRHAEGAGRLADDEEISRSHARLSLDRTGFCAIEDLGSTNGTYVNGLRIKGPETLSEGDTIEVGATTLVVRELPIPHSEHTLRAIPSRPTIVPVPDKTRRLGAITSAPPRPASRAPQQAHRKGRRSPPRTPAPRPQSPATSRVSYRQPVRAGDHGREEGRNRVGRRRSAGNRARRSCCAFVDAAKHRLPGRRLLLEQRELPGRGTRAVGDPRAVRARAPRR